MSMANGMNGGATTLKWIRSSFCSTTTCVEVTSYLGRVLIRDSKQNGCDIQPTIALDIERWHRLTTALMATPDIDETDAVVTVARDGWVDVVDQAQGTMLQFTQLEWTAFIAGLRAGDFGLVP